MILYCTCVLYCTCAIVQHFFGEKPKTLRKALAAVQRQTLPGRYKQTSKWVDNDAGDSFNFYLVKDSEWCRHVHIQQTSFEATT
jgi:hypothetical protein